MEKDLRLRKIEGRLYSNGQGVIIFSVWDIIQIIMMFTMNSQYVLERAGVVNVDSTTTTIALVFVAVVAFIATLVDVYIGRSAMAFSRGEKKGILYIVLAGLSVIICVLGTVFTVVDDPTSAIENAKTLVESIITLTKTIIMIELVVNSIQLRRSEVK